MTKSYNQTCALALSLDRIGERWTLLIIRELLTGPKRFGELQAALPGAAANLLTDRLKKLQRMDLLRLAVSKDDRRGGVYHIKPNGEALAPAIHELIRWGGQFVGHAPKRNFHSPHWLQVAADAMFIGAVHRAPPTTLWIVDGEAFTLHHDGEEQLSFVPAADNIKPELELTGDYRTVLGVLAGKLRPLGDHLQIQGAWRGSQKLGLRLTTALDLAVTPRYDL